MKLHSIVDCITNSSSTTFIIGFEEIPDSIEKTHKILFPKGERILQWGNCEISSMKAAEIIFNDIKDPSCDRIYRKSQLPDFYNGVFFNYPNFNDEEKFPEIAKLKKESLYIYKEYKEKYGEDAICSNYADWKEKEAKISTQIYELQRDILDEAVKTASSKDWEKIKDLEVFVLEYSDDNDIDAILEYGEAFNNIPCIAISHH